MDLKPPSSLGATPAPQAPGSGVRASGGSGGRGPTGRGVRPGQFCCVFWLGPRCYALDVAYVGEVLPFSGLTTIPLTPPALLGMCNLRGTALAVVDLAAVLALPDSAGVGKSASILVLRSPRLTAGIRIDRAEAVLPFARTRFQARPAQGEHPAVQGVLELEERGGISATLLDGEAVIARVSALRFKTKEEGARPQQ